MARLIPSFVDERTPPGERDVFNMLAAGPDDWVAIHSLDLAPWNRRLRTEIDFLIIIPDTGIMCVEVKSHQEIAFEGDRWIPKEVKRSPFKQAADGRYAFYRGLRDTAPHLNDVPVVHCCIFPNAIFDLPPNLSVKPWELMDVRAFRSCASGTQFCSEVKVMAIRGIAADARLPSLARPLTPSRIDLIINACIPVRRRRPDAREEIERREEQVERMLREQQKPVLQLAKANSRLIVSGGAGTGKTRIAIEVARRAAEDGRRVALLCFNQLIGNWLIEQTEGIVPQLPNLVVGRAFQIMATMLDMKIPDSPSSEFWEVDLPAAVEERLTNPELKAVSAFDYLVIDEAQDILARPALWACLRCFVVGGTDDGAFALFGDFEHQVLSERTAVVDSLMEIAPRVTKWPLNENCRNYKIVGDTAIKLGGIKQNIYSGYLRAGGGLHNYDIVFYQNHHEQCDQIKAWLKDFRAVGYRPSEITLLSFRAGDSSAAARLISEGMRLRPVWQKGEGISYATVHAFKGLENKVIILTDVELAEAEFHRNLFYTGVTRALESVRVTCSSASRQTLSRWLTGVNDD